MKSLTLIRTLVLAQLGRGGNGLNSKALQQLRSLGEELGQNTPLVVWEAEAEWSHLGTPKLRLQTRQRNVLVSPTVRNTGRNLLDGALAGGAQACGRRIGQIASGYRADVLVLDHNHPRLYGRGGDDLLDSWIFSGNENLVRDVYVGGTKVIDQGRHANEEQIAQNYRNTLDQLAD